VSCEFVSARSQIEITVLVAFADAQIGDTQAKSIIARIKAMTGLSDFERARLIGYLGFLVCNPPNQRIINKFKDRTLKERKIVAEAAVSGAAADGHLRAEEVKVLERTYKTLGLPKEELYRDLHGLCAEERQPEEDRDVPTVTPAKVVRGIPIPARRTSANGSRRESKLDMSKIARIQADTVAVQTILGQVFDERGIDAEPELDPSALSSINPKPSLVTVEDKEELFPDLDPRHALLLYEISNRDVVDQATFAALAQKHGLLAHGAMEIINEWAFQKFEEPILDQGEPIEIAHHLIRSGQAIVITEQRA
jgi:tellurite resistance protein